MVIYFIAANYRKDAHFNKSKQNKVILRLPREKLCLFHVKPIVMETCSYFENF